MSVGSVIGIALLYEPINKFFMKILKISSEYVKWLINSLSISLAAGIAVSPFVAYYFGVYSIISPITNIFAVPLQEAVGTLKTVPPERYEDARKFLGLI